MVKVETLIMNSKTEPGKGYIYTRATRIVRATASSIIVDKQRPD